MAARKLLDEPISFDPACQPRCNPLNNKDGKCLIPCVKVCPEVCFNTTIPPKDYPSPPPAYSKLDYDDDEPPPSIHHNQKLLTISLAAASVLVFLLVCYSVYRFCNNRYNIRRRRSLLVQQQQQQQPDRDDFLDEEQGPNQAVEHHIWYIRTIGLDPSVISKITVVKYKKGEGLIEGTDCSVCLSEFQENETLRLLPKCNHAFHIPCIDTWLTAHTNCPLCRAGIVNTAAVLPSEERGVHGEEIRAEISVGVDEVVEGSQVVVGIEDHELDSTAQVAVRRSVSMDAISASRLALAVNNARVAAQSDDDDQAGEVKDDVVTVPKSNGINLRLLRLVGGLSIDRPACIKRSASCNANV